MAEGPMQLNCTLSIPEVAGLPSQQLTVGRRFLFLCEGQAPGFDLDKAQLILSEANKYSFQLMKASTLPNQSGLQLEMVSYVASEISAGELKLTDGKNEILAQVPTIKLESVLPPPEKNSEGTAQPPEPFGYQILNIQWPVGYTIFFVVIFCAVIAGLVVQMRKARRYQRLIAELKDYNSAIAPDLQFYKHIRLMEKKNYPVAEVERQFHIYIIRRYQVPLYGLSQNEVTRFMKKKWPTLVKERRELKNILSDLKKMALKENPEETQKYLKKLYQFVDHSEEILEGHP